jgi:hypothetical protein
MFKAFNVVILSLSATLLVIGCGKNETTPENAPAKASATPPAAAPEYSGVWYGDCVVEGANSSQLSLISGPTGASIVTTSFEGNTACSGDKVFRIEVTQALEIGEKVTAPMASADDSKLINHEAKITGNAYKTNRNAITEAIASISPLALESANTSGFCGKKDWSKTSENYKLVQAIPAAELANCASPKSDENYAAYVERLFPLEKNSKKISYLVVINGENLTIVQLGENGQPSVSLPVIMKKTRVSDPTLSDIGKPGGRPHA